MTPNLFILILCGASVALIGFLFVIGLCVVAASADEHIDAMRRDDE